VTPSISMWLNVYDNIHMRTHTHTHTAYTYTFNMCNRIGMYMIICTDNYRITAEVGIHVASDDSWGARGHGRPG